MFFIRIVQLKIDGRYRLIVETERKTTCTDLVICVSMLITEPTHDFNICVISGEKTCCSIAMQGDLFYMLPSGYLRRSFSGKSCELKFCVDKMCETCRIPIDLIIVINR